VIEIAGNYNIYLTYLRAGINATWPVRKPSQTGRMTDWKKVHHIGLILRRAGVEVARNPVSLRNRVSTLSQLK
jgi:hypothetical protein